MHISLDVFKSFSPHPNKVAFIAIHFVNVSPQPPSFMRDWKKYLVNINFRDNITLYRLTFLLFEGISKGLTFSHIGLASGDRSLTHYAG